MPNVSEITIRQLNDQVADLIRKGRLQDALPLANRARQEAASQAAGSLDLATGLSQLAQVQRELGQFGQAESPCLRALNLRAQLLGKDHPDYASSLHELGRLYDALGSYKQADTLYQNALE